MKEFSKKFISATKEFTTVSQNVPAPYFRKTFSLAQIQTPVRIFICGLGFYRLWINGKEITKGAFAPYVSNPDELLFYDEYDVTQELIVGKNVIAVLLGNGFQNNVGIWAWDFDKARWRSSPKLAISVFSGEEVLFEADETFKCAPSPVLFDDLRMGELYDARFEIPRWNEPSFDDSAWDNAFVAETPYGEPTLCNAEPIRVIAQIKPVNYFRHDGGYVFDFGVNTAGVCKLKIRGNCGQKIRFTHGEALLEDKTVYVKNTATPLAELSRWQKDVYICSGKGEEEYIPSFTYHGFRYVFLEGIEPSQVDENTLTLLQMSSSLSQAGEFSCSNQVINDLQKITLNSDRSNFYYFPTDCPQREKNGWTGDIALSCEQLLYNLNCEKSLREWLKCVRYAQRENGMLPGIVPTAGWGYEWGSGPSWDFVLTEVAYRLYQFTGDKRILAENILALKKYVSYLQTRKNADGLFAFGLGEWLQVGKTSEEITDTPLEVTDSLTCYEIYCKCKAMACALQDGAFANECERLRLELYDNFRKKYLDGDLFVSCKSQTAQAKALSLGIFTEEENGRAFDNLVRLIEEKNNRFDVGILGAKPLFRVLAENGKIDLALCMMTQDGFPSFKYWLDNGATSLWEGFNELYPNSIFRTDGGRVLSLNHHVWGDISAFFYEYIAGIKINPNCDDSNFFLVSPAFGEQLSFAKGSYQNERGSIAVSWEKTEIGARITVRTTGDFYYRLNEHFEIAEQSQSNGAQTFEVKIR